MSRFKHDLDFYKLTTCDMGKLVPVGWKYVLPGDTFQHSTTLLVRMSPTNFPVMHPTVVRVHHWFVPLRILWTDFEKFITGGPDGADASVHPYIVFNNAAVGSLADQLDVTPLVASNRSRNALPFRAYAKIFNENYRDEDLTTELVVSTASGADSTTNTTLQSCAWEKDRYTSARLDPQKGTAVTLPLGTSAPVTRVANAPYWQAYLAGSNGNPGTTTPLNLAAGQLNDGAANALSFDPRGGLIADLSTATAADVNDIRWALALQRYKEARSKYGSRYTEYLAYLGIRSSDARLQRPEYLGGGKQTLQYTEILQHAPSTSGTPGTGVGILKGHGIGTPRTNRYRRFFEEHGIVMTLISVRPKTLYGNGTPKELLYTTKEDYWQKELQHVGQQEITNQEIYTGDSGPTDVFGYNDRYDEYRFSESRISGEFRTSTFNFAHLARIFSGDVTLNSSFVTCDPAESRILQSTATDALQIMAYHHLKARRLVSPTGSTHIY